ncbi:Dicer-like protein 1 [Mortierella antarctica]|nr:Dicer-like protein 1 [Mortierella antarctica]
MTEIDLITWDDAEDAVVPSLSQAGLELSLSLTSTLLDTHSPTSTASPASPASLASFTVPTSPSSSSSVVVPVAASPVRTAPSTEFDKSDTISNSSNSHNNNNKNKSNSNNNSNNNHAGEAPPDPYLVPRRYQTELFRKAQQGNVIAVMDTGSGKTLVAVMLINEMMRRERDSPVQPTERRMCFFVVNNVPLVFQQASVIRTNCDATVVELCGTMQTYKFDPQLWEGIFAKADVVVLTAQILLDLLRHGFVKMHRIHLLIFDECHHARKDHPFCCIMREFYRKKNGEACAGMPKIFGMTASPSSDIGSRLIHAATELENLMNSKVFTVEQDLVKQFVERPLELVVQYNPAPEYPTTPLTQRMRNDCSMVTKLAAIFESSSVNLKHLGPWCVDRLWKIFTENLANNTNFQPLAEGSQTAVDIVKTWPFSPPICDPILMTPKVLKLIQLLRAGERSLGEEFCGIIFVQRRDTAIALCLLLQELEEFKDTLRVQVLAGHGDETESVLRMSFREQNVIITGFRNKVYNLLVSTSVAEEGLDIQPCNVVIRFDPVTSTIGYIQSRGRARKKNSRYIMMHEYDNRAEEATLEKIQYGEQSMKEWCQSLDEERLMHNPAADDDDSSLDTMSGAGQTYRVPSTGALLTMDSAIALLHNYCNTLSGDEFCSLKPEFNVTPHGTSGFVCDLTLPPNAPIRLLQSDHTSTKSMAKKSAAFKTCEKLHTLGALNDHLLPVLPNADNDDAADDNAPVDKNDKNKAYPLAIPLLWKQEPVAELGESTPLFRCVVQLAPEELERLGWQHRYRSMCILTRRPLPCVIAPFYLYVDGGPRVVTMKSNPVPLNVGEVRLEQLHKFTLSLFGRITRKSFECALDNMPYFIAPLCRTYDPDDQDLQQGVSWKDVQTGQSLDPLEFPIEAKDQQSLAQCVVTLRLDRGREFLLKKSLPQFSLQDQMPEDKFRHELDMLEELIAKEKKSPAANGKVKEGQATTTRSDPEPVVYGEKTFGAFFKARYRTNCPEDDIIVLAERVHKMRNNLQPAVRDEERNEDASAVILPLSGCVQCTVQADILRMSQLIPSVLFNLDSALLVHDVREVIGLQGTHLDYLQVAFTSSSANRDHHYERLELLGDSFLKFSSTIRLYIVNPAKDEGQLHGARIRIISNKALLRNAIHLELYKYVSSTPFHRKSWRPTRFIVGGKAWEEVQYHKLSNKTLADIIEASLGAAYLSGGVRNALKAAKALHIPFGGFDEWDDFHRVHSAARAEKDRHSEDPPATLSLTPTQQKRINEIQKTLGYTFKDPRLFFEAMTHASHIRPDATCYQRLEFLGDAVLDFQVIRYYYSKYHDAPPGAITLIKDASVNNAILGAISINWGLQRYLEHYSPTLVGAIARAIVAVESKKEAAGDEGLTGEYWTEVNMPKVLGDLVESTLGAVFVDSGFDFEVVTDLFTRLIRPFLDKHVDFASIVIHPTKALVETLQSQGCNNFRFVSDAKAPVNSTLKILRKLARGPESGEPALKCHFQVHDKILYTAMREGENIEELRKEAAVATLALLKNDPQLLASLCTCPKKRGARHMTMLDRYRQ